MKENKKIYLLLAPLILHSLAYTSNSKGLSEDIDFLNNISQRVQASRANSRHPELKQDDEFRLLEAQFNDMQRDQKIINNMPQFRDLNKTFKTGEINDDRTFPLRARQEIPQYMEPIQIETSDREGEAEKRQDRISVIPTKQESRTKIQEQLEYINWQEKEILRKNQQLDQRKLEKQQQSTSHAVGESKLERKVYKEKAQAEQEAKEMYRRSQIIKDEIIKKSKRLKTLEQQLENLQSEEKKIQREKRDQNIKLQIYAK